jgi:hypothetical protein
MITVQQLRDRIQQVSVPRIVEYSAEEQREGLADINREQLLQGIESSGNKISPEYASKSYARRKQSMNSAPGLGTPDLKLTGEFHRQLIAKVSEEEIVFSSRDEKNDRLVSKYGEDIFGFTDDGRTKAGKLIHQRFKHWYTDATGLEFR